MKTSTKIALTITLVGKHPNTRQITESFKGDGDGETNDDVKQKV